MLTEFEKVRIRYHMDLAFAGQPISGVTIGIRTVLRAGELEAYMNNLGIEEESMLLGEPYAAFKLYGPRVAGDVLAFTYNSNTYNYTVTSQDVAARDPLATILQNAANGINLTGWGIAAAASLYASNPSSAGLIPTFGQLTATFGGNTFTLTGSGPGLFQMSNGSALPPPSIPTVDANGDPVQINGLLPICDYLESSFGSIDQRLAFSQAGASSTGQVQFNKAEMRQRWALYKYYVRKMAVTLAFSVSNHASQGRQGYGLPGS